MFEPQELRTPCVACSFVQWRPPDFTVPRGGEHCSLN